MNLKPEKPELYIEDLSVVFIGDFNPMIFQPAWFAYHDLLRLDEIERAEVKVIHQDVAEFSVDWLSVQVLRDRFTARIKADAYYTHLYDFVRGTLQLVSHTPVYQAGFNTTWIARFRDLDNWHAFGHFLAVKSPWRGVLSKPGMRGIGIQGERADGLPGYTVVNISPTNNAPGSSTILVNEHYEKPKNAEQELGAGWVFEVINTNAEVSLQAAREMADNLFNNFCNNNVFDDGQ